MSQVCIQFEPGNYSDLVHGMASKPHLAPRCQSFPNVSDHSFFVGKVGAVYCPALGYFFGLPPERDWGRSFKPAMARSLFFSVSPKVNLSLSRILAICHTSFFVGIASKN